MVVPRRSLTDPVEPLGRAEYCAFTQLVDLLSVDFLPGGLCGRNWRCGFLSAFVNFGLVHQHVATTRVEIDTNHVSTAQKGEPAPVGAFR